MGRHLHLAAPARDRSSQVSQRKPMCSFGPDDGPLFRNGISEGLPTIQELGDSAQSVLVGELLDGGDGVQLGATPTEDTENGSRDWSKNARPSSTF